MYPCVTITIAFAALAAVPALSARGKTTFAQRTLSVAGDKDINATAVNAKDAILADVFDTAAGNPSGGCRSLDAYGPARSGSRLRGRRRSPFHRPTRRRSRRRTGRC